MKNVTVVTHPLVQHKLTLMRRKDTSVFVGCCGRFPCFWPMRSPQSWK